MKNYQVLSKVGRFSACVEREFDEYNDAKAFCDLLKKSSTSSFTEYYITVICGNR